MQSLSEVIQTEAQSGASVLFQKSLLGLVPHREQEACGVSLGLSPMPGRFPTWLHVRTIVLSSFAQQMLALLEQFHQEKID